MDLDSLYNELNIYNEPCLIINDVGINPIEVLIIVKNKKKMWKHFNKAKDSIEQKRILVDKRFVRFYSFKELGIENSVDSLIARGKEIRPNVHQLCFEDIIPILMIFISFYFHRDCFLKEYYSHVVQKFLLDNGYEKEDFHLFYKKAFKRELKNRMHIVFIRRARRKLALCLIRKEMNKEISKQDDYIDNLCRCHVITNNGKRIEQSSGRSLSIFFEDIWNDNHVFFKGGGYSRYCSAQNEIEAHKALKNCKDDWFLHVYDYSEENCWVAYPYIEETYMDKILAKRRLSAKELNVLYEFLIEALDGLMQYGVSHNDFRIENIIAIMDEKQELSSCRLYDFGCAATKGRYPWEENSFVSKEIGMMVNGNYRYSSEYIDDAAAAYLIYIQAGGDARSNEAKAIYSRIGRQFVYSDYGILDQGIVIE